MGCATCGGGGVRSGSQTIQQVQRNSAPVVINLNCEYTGGILRVWMAALECVKNTGQLEKISLSTQKANSHLGYLQSAINHPDNYCLFETEIKDFQQNILPRIIADVPSCL